MASTLAVSRSAAKYKLLQIANSVLTNEQLEAILCAVFEQRSLYNFTVADSDLTDEDDRILRNMRVEK